MPAATGLQKAHLEIEGEPRIDCWFNPKEYSITKTNDWNARPIVGAALPPAQFGGGHARELTLDLLFDGSDSSDRDVRDVTDRLFRMMEVDPALGTDNRNQGRPPMVTFAWGRTVSFKAVAKSLSVQFTLFNSDGTPIRAQAKLSLQQAEKADSRSSRGPSAAQNPVTRAQAGARSHVLRDGDSLQSIAYSAYGDAARWRRIAEANGIDDPLRLARGATLAIPSLEQ